MQSRRKSLVLVIVLAFILLVLAGLHYAQAHFLSNDQTLAVAYGIGILTLSLGSTIVLAKKLLSPDESRQIPSGGVGSVSSRTSLFVTVIAGGKIVVLGALLYYGLIVLDLSPLYLVGGAVAGLCLVTSGSLLIHRLTSTPSQTMTV